jgi:hypothetical protein
MKIMDPKRDAARHGKEADGWSQQGLAGHRSGEAAIADPASLEWPTKHELYVAARSHWAFVLGELIATMIRAAAASAQELRDRYRQRHGTAFRDALRRLDGR